MISPQAQTKVSSALQFPFAPVALEATLREPHRSKGSYSPR